MCAAVPVTGINQILAVSAEEFDWSTVQIGADRIFDWRPAVCARAVGFELKDYRAWAVHAAFGQADENIP